MTWHSKMGNDSKILKQSQKWANFLRDAKFIKLELFYIILAILLSKIIVLCDLIYLLLIWKESKDLKREQPNL